jgi:hypothetical protein
VTWISGPPHTVVGNNNNSNADFKFIYKSGIQLDNKYELYNGDASGPMLA